MPPRWARSLDVICLLLLGLAVIVAVWGGFRMRIAGVRLALTSPYRVLIAAVLLALVRHWLSPAAPIYRDLPVRIAAGWRSAPVKAAWSVLIGTRPAILLVGYLAVVMLGYAPDAPPHRLSENEFVNLQVRWDMSWYFGIATDGYRLLSHSATDQQNIVFFPAYPMLMRVAGRLLGGAPTSFLLGGTLVALGAFFWAMIYLFRLARELIGDDDHARYALWLAATFPFALFYSAMYTESVFLLGATGAFYHLRRREYWQAGAWGLLVGLTRPNGCFLAIPLAVLCVTPWLPKWLAGRTLIAQPSDVRPGGGELMAGLAAAAMPGVGVLLYSAFIWRLAGNPLAWAAGHAAWGREYSGLWRLVTDRYAWFANEGVYAYTSQVPGDFLNGLGVLFVLIATWPVMRRFGLAYGVFILINILPPLAAGGLLSAGRFSSVLFPAFLWFSTVVPISQRPGWLTGFMALQALNATLFYTWRQLF
jgi:hypothetical protein